MIGEALEFLTLLGLGVCESCRAARRVLLGSTGNRQLMGT
jgi:hypothetical protein